MGVACKINRNQFGEPVSVETRNGAESNLFNSLLARFNVDQQERNAGDSANRQEALQLWLASQTKKYLEAVKNPQLRDYRSTLEIRLGKINTKGPVVEVDGRNIKIDNPETTNLNNTLVAFGRVLKEDGTEGEAIRLGRIRYMEDETTITIDSSLVNPEFQGNGVGSRMYAELFKYALRQDKNLRSSSNIGPNSIPLWEKMANMGMARQVGNRFVFNNFPPNYDENGEPSADAIIDYVDRLSYKEALSVQDEVDIFNALIGINAKSNAELLEKLSIGFKPEGSFKPTRASLERSGLYTTEEIQDLLTNRELQENAKEMIYKLEKWDAGENQLVENISQDQSNIWVAKDGSKNALGKFNLENPYVIERKLVELVGGIDNRIDFEDALLNSDLAPIAFDATPQETAALFNRMRSYKPVAEIRIEDGQLQSKQSDTKELMEQTLKVPENTKLEDQADFLVALSNSVWQDSPAQLTTLLNAVEAEMINVGIDAVGETGFSDAARASGIEATKDFLTAVRNFAIDQNESTVNNLIEAYDEFFGIEPDYKYTKVRLAEGENSKNVFMLKTDVAGPELFSKYGLIPIGNNLYKRTNMDVPVDEILQAFYNYTIANNGYKNILNDEAFNESLRDENGNLDYAAIQDMVNMEVVKQSFKDYAESLIGDVYLEQAEEVDLEQLTKYVLYYNFYNRNEDFSKFDVKPPMAAEMVLVANDNARVEAENQDYLESEFIADFHVKTLKEKKKNSTAYSEFFSNFAIDRDGIRLVNNDPITLRNIQPYLEDNPNLVRYFNLKKNRESLVPAEELDTYVVDEVFRQYYYSNYPTALRPFKGNYQATSNLDSDFGEFEYAENTIVAESKAPFIRTSQGVYEYVMGSGRKALYLKLPTSPGEFKSSFVVRDRSKEVDDVHRNAMDSGVYEQLNANLSIPPTTIKNLYSKNEKEDIDNNYDNC